MGFKSPKPNQYGYRKRNKGSATQSKRIMSELGFIKNEEGKWITKEPDFLQIINDIGKTDAEGSQELEKIRLNSWKGKKTNFEGLTWLFFQSELVTFDEAEEIVELIQNKAR